MSSNQNETNRVNLEQNLPMVLKPFARRKPFFNANYRPDASFVTQIIAAKSNVPAYRQKRRGSANEAQSAYIQNDQRKIVRMPVGYLRTLDA